MMKKGNKLGVIVPYRNREEHLFKFLPRISAFLKKEKINYEIIIVNQDNAKLFNRGMLLNIGFKEAKNLKCNYVCFHDVDLIPIEGDYSYSLYPVHLANGVFKGDRKMGGFDEYFGGITIFPVEDFEKVDGYSNKYWGWGFEDTDLLHRCKKRDVKLKTIKHKNMGLQNTGVRFNGVNAYVKGKNNINFNSDLFFFVSFYPDNVLCDPNKDSDTFCVFSIPGYDFSINYNSFFRYNFCAFDDEKNVLFVNSKIKKNYKTNIGVNLNLKERKIVVYQDGIKMGETKFKSTLLNYTKKKNFYLGVGDPKRRGDERFYKGTIDYFGVFNCNLNFDEIKEISNAEIKEDTDVYKRQKKNGSIEVFYSGKKIKDYKLIDLSDNNNHGKIFKCEIVNENLEKYVEIQTPHKRTGIYESLSHEENGFINNKWKTQHTRWNQLRFNNEVLENDKLISDDGLSTLYFTEHGKEKLRKENITKIDVGL